MSFKVYVVVVLYNGAKWVEKCFGSLKASNLPVEVIAVDNASSDEGVKILKNSFKGVTLIRAGSNLGFGKANNLGIKHALNQGAEYVFLLNQDAWIAPDTIETLVKIRLKNTNYEILSPMHLTGTGDKLDYYFSYYLKETNTPSITSDLYMGRKKEVYMTNFVNAAAWLISRNCIETIGLFDEIFPHYGEDADYIGRLKFHGMEVGIVVTAVIYHDRDQRISYQEETSQQKFIKNLVAAKNLNGSFAGNIIYIIKSEVDALLTALIFRRFKETKARLIGLVRLLSRLNLIHNSYRASKKRIF